MQAIVMKLQLCKSVKSCPSWNLFEHYIYATHEHVFSEVNEKGTVHYPQMKQSFRITVQHKNVRDQLGNYKFQGLTFSNCN